MLDKIGYMKKENLPEAEQMKLKRLEASFITQEELTDEEVDILLGQYKDLEKPLTVLGKCAGIGTYAIHRLPFDNPDKAFYGIYYTDSKDQAGAIHSYKPLDFQKAFELSFQIFLGSRRDLGSDGFSFVLHRDPRMDNGNRAEVIGLPKEFLGAMGAVDETGELIESSIQKGLMIEIDTEPNLSSSDKDIDYPNYSNKSYGHMAWRVLDNLPAKQKEGVWTSLEGFSHEGLWVSSVPLINNRWDNLTVKWEPDLNQLENGQVVSGKLIYNYLPSVKPIVNWDSLGKPIKEIVIGKDTPKLTELFGGDSQAFWGFTGANSSKSCDAWVIPDSLIFPDETSDIQVEYIEKGQTTPTTIDKLTDTTGKFDWFVANSEINQDYAIETVVVHYLDREGNPKEKEIKWKNEEKNQDILLEFGSTTKLEVVYSKNYVQFEFKDVNQNQASKEIYSYQDRFMVNGTQQVKEVLGERVKPTIKIYGEVGKQIQLSDIYSEEARWKDGYRLTKEQEGQLSYQIGKGGRKETIKLEGVRYLMNVSKVFDYYPIPKPVGKGYMHMRQIDNDTLPFINKHDKVTAYQSRHQVLQVMDRKTSNWRVRAAHHGCYETDTNEYFYIFSVNTVNYNTKGHIQIWRTNRPKTQIVEWKEKKGQGIVELILNIKDKPNAHAVYIMDTDVPKYGRAFEGKVSWTLESEE
ncbi:lectin-like domain-containing protein [Vagococcus humatus]|uniref:Uncharacterized protein n=1 Tax=Vagococcus humatus TaxID=1889241 RepID=A0A429Z837_9ENTE|nr:hypothetical protein [Vagococcus humatus]RST89880.1 hypothetical protein C7P63_02030 [Vagococcus humatus]